MSSRARVEGKMAAGEARAEAKRLRAENERARELCRHLSNCLNEAIDMLVSEGVVDEDECVPFRAAAELGRRAGRTP